MLSSSHADAQLNPGTGIKFERRWNAEAGDSITYISLDEPAPRDTIIVADVPYQGPWVLADSGCLQITASYGVDYYESDSVYAPGGVIHWSATDSTVRPGSWIVIPRFVNVPDTIKIYNSCGDLPCAGWKTVPLVWHRQYAADTVLGDTTIFVDDSCDDCIQYVVTVHGHLEAVYDTVELVQQYQRYSGYAIYYTYADNGPNFGLPGYVYYKRSIIYYVMFGSMFLVDGPPGYSPDDSLRLDPAAITEMQQFTPCTVAADDCVPVRLFDSTGQTWGRFRYRDMFPTGVIHDTYYYANGNYMGPGCHRDSLIKVDSSMTYLGVKVYDSIRVTVPFWNIVPCDTAVVFFQREIMDSVTIAKRDTCTADSLHRYTNIQLIEFYNNAIDSVIYYMNNTFLFIVRDYLVSYLYSTLLWLDYRIQAAQVCCELAQARIDSLSARVDSVQAINDSVSALIPYCNKIELDGSGNGEVTIPDVDAGSIITCSYGDNPGSTGDDPPSAWYDGGTNKVKFKGKAGRMVNYCIRK